MALDTPDIFLLDSLPHEQAVLDLEYDFSLDEPYFPPPKRIVRFDDASKDAIFLRDDACMGSLGRDGVEYVCGGYQSYVPVLS